MDVEVMLEQLREVFPGIPRNRFQVVCERYIAEKRADPLGAAVEYFLNNPDGGQLGPLEEAAYIPLVDLSAYTSDEDNAAPPEAATPTLALPATPTLALPATPTRALSAPAVRPGAMLPETAEGKRARMDIAVNALQRLLAETSGDTVGGVGGGQVVAAGPTANEYDAVANMRTPLVAVDNVNVMAGRKRRYWASGDGAVVTSTPVRMDADGINLADRSAATAVPGNTPLAGGNWTPRLPTFSSLPDEHAALGLSAVSSPISTDAPLSPSHAMLYGNDSNHRHTNNDNNNNNNDNNNYNNSNNNDIIYFGLGASNVPPAGTLFNQSALPAPRDELNPGTGAALPGTLFNQSALPAPNDELNSGIGAALPGSLFNQSALPAPNDELNPGIAAALPGMLFNQPALPAPNDELNPGTGAALPGTLFNRPALPAPRHELNPGTGAARPGRSALYNVLFGAPANDGVGDVTATAAATLPPARPMPFDMPSFDDGNTPPSTDFPGSVRAPMFTLPLATSFPAFAAPAGRFDSNAVGGDNGASTRLHGLATRPPLSVPSFGARLGTASAAESSNFPGADGGFDLGGDPNDRQQPVAQNPNDQRPKFHMHHIKQTVMTMFPDIEEGYLEDLIQKQPDDHANRVCNLLLENSGFPRRKPVLKKPVASAVSQASSLKREYLTDKTVLGPVMTGAVHRLLLFDFPQVAAVDIRYICKVHQYHYSPARQHIEQSLKGNEVVIYSEQLVEAGKLQAAQQSLSELGSKIGALQTATDDLVTTTIKMEVRKLLTAPAPGQPRSVYDNYRRDCMKQARNVARGTRHNTQRLISRVASDLVEDARNAAPGGAVARLVAVTVAPQAAQSSSADDKSAVRPLALLKCPRRLARPTNLPLELQEEAAYYDKYLKISLEKTVDTAQASSVGDSSEGDEQLIECGCCYGEVTFQEMVQCSEGHLFCEDCLRSYVKEAVYGQGKSDLICMTDGCDSKFFKSQLEKALPEDVIAKYYERVQEESLAMAQMAGLVQCPFCDFKALMAPDDKVFRCANEECLKESCRYCQENWADHFGIPCKEVEKKDETKFRTRVEELMTQAKVRKCPKCGTEFYKEDGCNKMTCRCGTSMCYICRKPKINYNHFCQHPRDPGHGCKKCTACGLWSVAKEDDALAVEEVRERLKREHIDETGEEFDKLIGPPPEGPPAKKKKRP